MKALRASRSDPGWQRGFTLVELIIASGIAIALVSAILSIAVQSMSSYNRISDRLEAEQEGRFALDVLVSDLQSLVYRDDGSIWFSAQIVDSDQNTKRMDSNSENLWKRPASESRQKPKGVSFENSEYGQNGVWLRLFASVVDRDRKDSGVPIGGDICAVAYQILRRGATIQSEGTGMSEVAKRTYGLYRTVVNSDRTFQSGYDYSYNAANLSDYWNGMNVSGNLGEPVEVLRPDRDLLLASNVIEFGLRFYDEFGTEFEYDALQDPAVNSLGEIRSFDAPGVGGGRLPRIVDIYLRLLTREGARLILRFEQGRLRSDLTSRVDRNEYWKQIAADHSIEIERRIQIFQGPLL